MSGEQLSAKELNRTTVTYSSRAKSQKVDINNLLSRIRQKQNKEKKENYIFLGLVVGIVTVTGVIASL